MRLPKKIIRRRFTRSRFDSIGFNQKKKKNQFWTKFAASLAPKYFFTKCFIFGKFRKCCNWYFLSQLVAVVALKILPEARMLISYLLGDLFWPFSTKQWQDSNPFRECQDFPEGPPIELLLSSNVSQLQLSANTVMCLHSQIEKNLTLIML